MYRFRPLSVIVALGILVLVLLILLAQSNGTSAARISLEKAELLAYVPTMGETQSPTPTVCPLNWRVIVSPNAGSGDNRLARIAVISANDVWAVGTYIDAGVARALTLHWNGSEWHIVPNLEQDSSALTDVVAIASDDVWAVGAYASSGLPVQHSMALHWDGISWTRVSTPDPGRNANLTAVTAIDSNNVWAVGEYVPDGFPSDVIFPFSARWDGTTWSMIPMPVSMSCFGSCSQTFDSIDAISNSDVWAAGTSFDSGPFTTFIQHWDGTAWSIVPSPNPGAFSNFLHGVTAISANDVWAVGYTHSASGPEQTLTLHWDGTQWSQVTSANAGTSSNSLWDVAALSSSDIWATGSYLNNGVEETLSLHWDGLKWTVIPSPNSNLELNRLVGIDVASADEVWVVGYYSGIGLQTLIERYGANCVTPSATPSATATVPSSPTATVTTTSTATNSPTAVPSQTPMPTATACTINYTDVLPGSTFHPYIMCLSCQGIVSGYGADCSTGVPCFKPQNFATRGQMAKIVANSAGFHEPVDDQQYEDIPTGSTFFDFVWRLTERGFVTGYPCGGEGEPCGSTNLPYYRPNANVTRGQLSKIVSEAAGLAQPTGTQQFEDVQIGSTFFDYIWRLTDRDVVQGYPCGGIGEPCADPPLPYFRPGSPATRGQASKVVATAFFADCDVR